MDFLLTNEELALHAMLGEVYCAFGQILADGATRQDDLMEARILVHGLQDMICRNAAARAYPKLVRQLGAAF